MASKSFRAAINEALKLEMRRDSRVIVMGEDVAGGRGGSANVEEAWGGPFGMTRGLYKEFGATRVLDTPITESAFVGATAGAAMTGLRPVAEVMFVDFTGVCFDQIMNQIAKIRYMFGGKAKLPLVIRMLYGAGYRAGAQHSQCLYPIYTHLPGLKVAVPSNPHDAKGLLISAIRDEDPVLFFEHKAILGMKGEVPDEAYEVPLGKANIVRPGKDVTVVAIGRMVHMAEKAAAALAKEGIDCEVIDPRTTSPLDAAAILASVRKTGRLVAVDEAYPRCNMATDIAALAAQEAFGSLRAPVRMVSPPHVPVPFAAPLEDLYIPNADKVAEAVRATVKPAA
ncbi:MAG: alpha-ketoacid dehydrogenase subunit beta [Alphaproteobacteria bacterium]